MTAPIEMIAIVIPARDEHDGVGRAVEAAQLSRRVLALSHPAIETALLVVADACVDDTVDEARAAGAEVIEVGFGNVGAARAAGIEHLRRRFDGDPVAVWIASTDADSIVPAEWLAGQVREADGGADAVIGTVTPAFAAMTDRQVATWQATHVPGVANGHVHGANLGVRLSSYLAVGGYPPLAVSEDVELVENLRAHGATIVASAAVDVITSSRLDARAPQGYSAYIAGLG
ncbi:MAG: glycosyltransferase [Microbacteriaceae bacterium]